MNSSSTDTASDVRVPPPALYSPTAVGSWSLLLTPVFGGILLARNWHALGQPAQAALSMRWVYGSLIVAMSKVAFPFPATSSGKSLLAMIGFGVFIAWYQCEVTEQLRFLATTKTAYTKRALWRPVVVAAVVLGLLIATMVGAAIAARREIEASVKDIVTEQFTDELQREVTCASVRLGRRLPNGTVEATATLDDGTEVRVHVRIEGTQLSVGIRE